MLGFLWRLIVGRFKLDPIPEKCNHKWKQNKIIKSKDCGWNFQDGHFERSYEIILDRCEKCGEIKKTSTRYP